MRVTASFLISFIMKRGHVDEISSPLRTMAIETTSSKSEPYGLFDLPFELLHVIITRIDPYTVMLLEQTCHTARQIVRSNSRTLVLRVRYQTRQEKASGVPPSSYEAKRALRDRPIRHLILDLTSVQMIIISKLIERISFNGIKQIDVYTNRVLWTITHGSVPGT